MPFVLSGLPPGRLHEAFIEAMAMKRRAFFVNFIQSPIVLVGLLAVAFGINHLIKLMEPFYLPPSVVTTLVLFAILLLLSAFSPKGEDENGEPSTERKYVAPVLAVIEKPCDLILKHMAVCFTPSFILIPSGETIAPKQIGLLIAYFIVSYAVVFGVSVGIHRLGGCLPFFKEKTVIQDVEASPVKSEKKQASRTTVAVVSTRPSGTTTPIFPFPASRLSFANTITPEMDAELQTRDWPRKGSDATLVNNFGPPEKSKCSDDEEADIGLQRPVSPTMPADFIVEQPTPSPNVALDERAPTPFPSADEEESAVQEQAKRRLAEELSTWMDIFLYASVFIIALPVFYTTLVSIPLFLALNIAVYLLVLRLISPYWKKFFHPILVTSFVVFFLVWGFGASVGWTLQETLASYSTPIDYIELWSSAPVGFSRAPGAGDLLVDGLDAGIIALALPLYRYRRDLRHYFFRMLFLILPSAVLSIFVWPLGGLAFQLAPATALAFVGRFSSTPLAVAQVERIQGNDSIVVVIVVVTGIVTVILEPVILKFFRIKQTDFLAIGLLVGVTSGAIGATGLLNSGKPRAAAIASLSFALFGTIILIAIGIPPVATYVQRLMGL